MRENDPAAMALSSRFSDKMHPSAGRQIGDPNEGCVLLARSICLATRDVQTRLTCREVNERGEPMQSVETNPVVSELHNLRKDWYWLLALGIALVLGGLVAISVPLIATVGIVTVVGILMLAAGIGQIISAISSARWSGVLLHILLGVLYAVTGFFVLENPLQGAAGLTLLMAAFFFTGGIFRIVFAVRERFPTWGWTLLNGAVTLLLGLIIWKQFPESTLWVIGLLVGIDMLFTGWTWIMLSFAVRSAPEPAAVSSRPL
jgi:uncharacterized membrane protein HdeD (DUF308 family)